MDGLAGTEHPFLVCSFWLVEQYAASGRVRAADAIAAAEKGDEAAEADQTGDEELPAATGETEAQT